jgi:gliding motility-associated protein GldM
MAGKLSPRQRMIGMMYLVLTALLALNVSKEIINAFVVVNESLELSSNNMTTNNNNTYSSFKKAMENDAKKTKPYYDKALKVQEHSNEMVAYIENLKKELIIAVEKVEDKTQVPALRDVARKDDYDIATNMMCGSQNDGRGHKASEFKDKLETYKKNLNSVLSGKTEGYNPIEIPTLDVLINTADPANDKVVDGKKSWEMVNFYHNPIVAVVALMTKFQNDIKNTEAEIITRLISQIDAASFKFDALSARVIAPTSYVLLGQEYTADVFLAAYSSTLDPEILVGSVDTAKKVLHGNGTAIPVSGGLGKYTARPSSEGLVKWGGIIKMKNPDNTFTNYPFTAEFIAAKPSSVVSADKMNVFYIGVDNPVSISVPGVANEKVTATISGGGAVLRKVSGNQYIVTATTQGEATINVSAQLDNKATAMGSFRYRVKRVPDPVAKIGGKREGNMPKSVLAAQSGVIAEMENFDFELYFRVKSFKMSRYGKGRDPIDVDGEGNLITSQMREVINQSRVGDKIYFEYIRATGPDGSVRSLPSVSFTIQ